MSDDVSSFLKEAHYINGQWITGNKQHPILDPATGNRVGNSPFGGRNEAILAIEAAAAALPGWRAMSAAKRAEILRALHAEIVRNLPALAQLITLEQGKPLAEARAEISASASYVLWFAEEARRIYGDVIPSPWQARRIVVTKEPVGVVAAITPWNFPSSMIARKLSPALAAGCTIVIKPATQTPFSALAWGVLCERAGVPAGVVNIVVGNAAKIGQELTTHSGVKKVTFTGSTPIGKLLAAQSSAHLKKVSMELGGNAPFVVFDDADLERAIDGALASKFRNSGQTCVCTNRFLVQESIHDDFVKRLSEEVSKLKIGNGMEPGIQQGPLIDDAAVAKAEEHISDAVANGAQIVSGGKRHRLGRTFFEPTVLTGATPNMLIAREETFGPVAAVFKFRSEQEAIELANSTEYGLAAYIYTRDLARAHRVSEALEYGIIGINEGLVTTEVAPFGGVKDSGFGREGSKYGLDDYLSIKYTCIGGLESHDA